MEDFFYSERKFGLCPFSCSDEHGLRKCPKFSRFKRKCSAEDYYKDSLGENDSLGYCAAGVCVFVGNKYLFLKEMRYGKIKYNFPGGGRETIQAKLGFEEAKLPVATGHLKPGLRGEPSVAPPAEGCHQASVDHLKARGHYAVTNHVRHPVSGEQIHQSLSPGESPIFAYPAEGNEVWTESNPFLRMENIFETAASEFAEEVGDLAEGGRKNSFIKEIQTKIITGSTECKIIWCSRIKYALVLVQIDDKLASTLIPAKIADKNAEAICFEWVDFSKKIRAKDFHSFVLPSVKKILDIQAMRCVNFSSSIFDRRRKKFLLNEKSDSDLTIPLRKLIEFFPRK